MLIGAGSYETLDGLPAVADSAQGLASLFTQRDIWGLPPAHCRVVLNPQTPRQLSKPVAEAAQEATDTLVVYYAGHGLIEPRTGELHLAVGDSDWMSVHDTAAPYDWIRRSIEQSPAVRKIAMIDCCYSARAFGVQSADVSTALEVDGSYVLTAAAENAVASAPPGEPYTAFTGELIKIINNGVPEGGEFIDLDTVYKKLRLELGIKGRPEPHRLCRNSLGTAPFIRNVAYEPLPKPSRPSWSRWTASHTTSTNASTDATQSEPYIRLATLRSLLDQLIQQLSPAQSFADTLQTVTDGVVAGLGYELAALNLVRPDGDLVVAAFAGNAAAEALITGRVGSRESWERRLSMGEAWGDLRFIPHIEGWILDDDDVPQWYTEGPMPQFEDEWHPSDRLFAPLYSVGSKGWQDLIGVISVDRPRNGRRPGSWGREALQMYAAHASVAIANAQLKANMKRALARLEREQQALRASEASFREAFEYAPSGMAVTELHDERPGRVVRTNDALCHMLGRSATEMRRYTFSDLVHPEDGNILQTTPARGGRAELRLTHRDGTYVWVSLRNSVIPDNTSAPDLLLVHVHDIEEPNWNRLQDPAAAT
ncbi:PAS domain S-box protein [Streptomyces chartreusis]|uniref:PAS domain S-box protein n=1 Tax=Streptomyces chartreusis TaxID=1969 RepID=A0A7H8TQ03_STRCX|nr:PAS domain S-box protein [Streptomyces chartreusis]